jgi:hypothetical protein
MKTKVTSRLVDKVMEDLREKQKSFSYQDIIDELVRRVNRRLDSSDKYKALAQFEKRIDPGKNQRYVFSREDGYARGLTEKE